MQGYWFSQLAKLDLMDIADYTLDRWGVGQAERYLDGLDGCFKRLVENPSGPGTRLQSDPARI